MKIFRFTLLTLFSCSLCFGGGSLQFDGVDDSVINTAMTDLLPDMSAKITVAFWYWNATNQAASRAQVSLFNTALSSQLTVGFRTGQYGVSKGGGTPLAITTTQIPSANKWHCVVYTWDKTTNSVYVDGALLGTSATAPDTGRTDQIRLGDDTFSEAWAGRLAYVQVSSTAWTVKEMTDYCSCPDNPTRARVGYWPLDGFKTYRDMSGYSTTKLTNLSAGASPVTATDGPPISVCAGGL